MRKLKIKTEEIKQVELLSDENADLIFQNAMQDMNIKTLQSENADLMLRLAMLETGGTA